MRFYDGRLDERFWDKVSPEPMSGCWLWMGATTDKGYASLRRGSRTCLVHRLVYETLVGGEKVLVLRHRCDVRSCVNPEHLQPGTHWDNSNDMVVRGRSCSGERSPSSVLSRSDVEQIRASSEPQGVLAHRFGVTQSCISRVKSGDTWRLKGRTP